MDHHQKGLKTVLKMVSQPLFMFLFEFAFAFGRMYSAILPPHKRDDDDVRWRQLFEHSTPVFRVCHAIDECI